jgi:ABC-type lipopolysaccharide export system ATPase subunit
MSSYSGTPALECKLLTKLYGQLEAFVEFNLVAHSGKIIGLLGPAGGGKGLDMSVVKRLTGFVWKYYKPGLI